MTAALEQVADRADAVSPERAGIHRAVHRLAAEGLHVAGLDPAGDDPEDVRLALHELQLSAWQALQRRFGDVDVDRVARDGRRSLASSEDLDGDVRHLHAALVRRTGSVCLAATGDREVHEQMVRIALSALLVLTVVLDDALADRR